MNELVKDLMFFGVLLTVGAYALGLYIQKKTRMMFLNPLLIAVSLIIALLLALGIDYESYYAGAKYLSYFLTPATVCLAVPLYRQLEALKSNWRAILAGIGTGVLTAMGSVWALARIFGLTHEQYVTLLPKSVTTAIGMGVSEALGGIVTITVAVIIVTGIFGNVSADLVYRLFRVTDHVAKGIGIGTSAHAVGTVKALEMGEVEGAMSSLAIVTSGLITVIAASFFAGLI